MQNALNIPSIFFGVVAPGPHVNKSDPTRRRAAVMSDTFLVLRRMKMVRPGVEMMKQVYLISVKYITSSHF
jgi:hypothetical protein